MWTSTSPQHSSSDNLSGLSRNSNLSYQVIFCGIRRRVCVHVPKSSLTNTNVLMSKFQNPENPFLGEPDFDYFVGGLCDAQFFFHIYISAPCLENYTGEGSCLSLLYVFPIFYEAALLDLNQMGILTGLTS